MWTGYNLSLMRIDSKEVQKYTFGTGLTRMQMGLSVRTNLPSGLSSLKPGLIRGLRLSGTYISKELTVELRNKYDC